MLVSCFLFLACHLLAWVVSPIVIHSLFLDRIDDLELNFRLLLFSCQAGMGMSGCRLPFAPATLTNLLSGVFSLQNSFLDFLRGETFGILIHTGTSVPTSTRTVIVLTYRKYYPYVQYSRICRQGSLKQKECQRKISISR